MKLMQAAVTLTLVTLLSPTATAGPKVPKKLLSRAPEPTKIDRLLEQIRRESPPAGPSLGSTYDASGRLSDVARDLRALHTNDVITVVVAEHSSATSAGGTSSARKSSTSATIPALAGITRAAGPWANLAGATGDTKLDGQGQTTRSSDLVATLTAQVIGVLPNGNLIVEGTKSVQINSERQKVTVRGIARCNDVNASNQISSERLAELEVQIDGHGVINDAVRRPNFLYRLLLGLLPF